MVSKICEIRAREIFDSRGNPTVEVDLCTEVALFRAAVPSGASTGVYEALELRDNDKSRLMGKGVLNAVANVNNVIAPKLLGMEVTKQTEIDKLMVETLDGTQNEWGWCKSKLGANAILAVSMALCRAGAAASKMPLYKYIAKLAGKPVDSFVMPVPSFNVINGGSHAGNRLACQEFMILPVGASTFREAMIVGAEVYHTLKACIKKKYGQDACNVGDEGGFAPSVQDNNEALDVLMEAIQKSGHEAKVKIGTDVAASEFYNKDTKKYDLDFKNPSSPESMKKTADEMIAYYKDWLSKYPFVSIEDPFDQDDWEAYSKFQAEVGSSVQIVGDDLLVTNPKRVQKALDVKACNALLLKVNQIGSITEAIEASSMSQYAGWGVMVSHRSGETEDSFIADLVVGLRTGEIKTGAPCRSERLAKYNQLLRIEEELESRCTYAGLDFRTVGCPKMGMFRKPVVGGNWKSTGSLQKVSELLTTFKEFGPDSALVDTVIFPPTVHVSAAIKASAGVLEIGVQNISKTAEGAFTGEVSAGMVQDLKLKWVMVGHSERRSLFGETDEDCAVKVEQALKKDLCVMFCIGELLEERKAGRTAEVCERQVKAVIPKVSDWSRVVIAYEPVWAIGTGVVATPLQAQEAHYQVRSVVRDACGAKVADEVRILYGGSVNTSNCQALGELPDVDGFLVGGASGKPDFTNIIEAAQKLYKA
mmetsp:Transcript_59540/g.138669  ORF Transcript_59540/g.138669 Transcript_59540/m.138669 type:complete len:704 (+) Transcript_59540:43-2154(+)|eukprot:CAMPEP_0171099776 /NCGR_PEP_ID=MMETSP0766_2-20121228/52543_1 /TAXON_ID=439317 /ORGANISM="Gambierdiscus australes, Strain CAWD 149" /LENGTH=703 /DNA_ID=CAMNT_0011559479 /DNA_START=42 /DNA_END=2153 /DNA_ORIENTATION=+